jgi:hypothetical protein
MIFLSTSENVFFYFSSLIQPSLEEDVSTEILLANKKLGSNVWKEFELIMLDDGTSKAICKHCKKDFVAGNRAATSYLKYHTGGLYMRAIQVIIVNRSWRSILKTRVLLELAIVLLIFWLGGGLMAQNIQAFLISRMARDILSVPLSTVASESIFSSAKRILDDYRWNLLPETIEAIMCSHDWLKGRIPGAYFYS